MVHFSFLVLAFSATLLFEYAKANYTINYSYFDVMAQSYCAGKVPEYEWAFALRRDCTMAPDCNTICVNATESIFSAIESPPKSVVCFDALYIIKNHSIVSPNPGDSQPDSGKVNMGLKGYGLTVGCFWPANNCGPSYCCCMAFGK